MTKELLKSKRLQLEKIEIQLYSAKGFDEEWLTSVALQLRREISELEKPTFKGAMTEQEWDELRDRVRAQKYLINWENELYETGVDEDAEWFIQYVWEKI